MARAYFRDLSDRVMPEKRWSVGGASEVAMRYL